MRSKNFKYLEEINVRNDQGFASIQEYPATVNYVYKVTLL